MTESGERQPGARERLVSRECAGCGTTITYAGVGRRPRYCSPACRQRSWALRTAEKRLGTPADPRPTVVREVVETVVRIKPPTLTQTYLEAKEAAERAAAAAAPSVPATAREWTLLLDQLATQLADPNGPLAREHWHHQRLYTAVIRVATALGKAHPGGLDVLATPRR
jgi:hypothetical protein